MFCYKTHNNVYTYFSIISFLPKYLESFGSIRLFLLTYFHPLLSDMDNIPLCKDVVSTFNSTSAVSIKSVNELLSKDDIK